MKMMRLSLAAIFTTSLALVAVTPAPAAKKKAPDPSKAAAAAPVKITSVEGITEYRLANGLTVLLFPDPVKPTITVNVTYKVGSRHENYGETGMAHLLEHLVFKGSPRHPNIPQELTSHGAQPNGTTSYDRTNYFETFAATDENLNWALDLEADRMVNSFISGKDLESEMTVVRNEFEAGENEPQSVLYERVLSTAYLWHNYGKSVIGARSDLENVPIGRLQAFYRTWYQPDNAVLTVSGKIDEAKTLALVRKYFGPIPRPARALPAIYTQEPVQDGERSVTLRRVGDVQSLFVAYHTPAAADPDSPAFDLLTTVIGDTPSGRLYKALVEGKQAASVFGEFALQYDPGYAMFGAEVRQQDSLETARATLLKTLDEAATRPPTVEEVNRARAASLKQMELTLNRSDRLGLALSEYIAAGDWRLFFLYRDRLKAVTPADVARVAAAWLKPSNRTVGSFIPDAQPDRAPPAAAPDLIAQFKGFKGGEALAAGEAFDPTPANLEARLQRKTLPGGMQLALLPKKTRGESVNVNLTLRFGDVSSLQGKGIAAEMAGGMLLRGTAKHSRQQIQDEFDRLKARVSATGGAASAQVSIETVRGNLPAVLRLVAESLREPAFPPAEFDSLKQEKLAETEAQRTEPQALAFIRMERHLNPYPTEDPRYTETPEESIASIQGATLAAAAAFHREFYGAGHGQLAAVGDFDPAELEKLAVELLGGWTSPKPYARLAEKYQPAAPINESIETPDKANATFVAGLNLKLRDDHADYPALSLGEFMLGGGFLNSRLAVRIRQKEGLSYGVGSWLSAGALDEKGGFGGYAIYAPQNAAKLEAAFSDEIAKVLKDGFTPAEIAEAKSGYLQQRQVARAHDGRLAGSLARYLHYARTFAWDDDFEKKIAALTPGQILAAMNAHLKPDQISMVKAGDFAGAAKKTPVAK